MPTIQSCIVFTRAGSLVGSLVVVINQLFFTLGWPCWAIISAAIVSFLYITQLEGDSSKSMEFNSYSQSDRLSLMWLRRSQDKTCRDLWKLESGYCKAQLFKSFFIGTSQDFLQNYQSIWDIRIRSLAVRRELWWIVKPKNIGWAILLIALLYKSAQLWVWVIWCRTAKRSLLFWCMGR